MVYMTMTFDPCKPVKTRRVERGSKLTPYASTVVLCSGLETVALSPTNGPYQK
jgi:hypothetical protein